jgi:tRNA-Thr(GGU) m(6)t(6)A37 methyltransferase TsaA
MPSALRFEPVAMVSGGRGEPFDDDWDAVEAIIRFDERFEPDALLGLDEFSHIEVVYVFDRVDPADVETSARHPRGNDDWPRVGIFAQRAKDRPNRLGTTIVRIIRREGARLHVRGLDAVEGTPVVDIKPVMAEFLPRGPVVQPGWARELMRGYWDGEPTANE